MTVTGVRSAPAGAIAGGDVTHVVLVALTTGAKVIFGVADAVLISTIVRRRKPRRRCSIDAADTRRSLPDPCS